MANLEYESVPNQPRDAVAVDLESDDPERISAALYSAAYHDPDWRWVQDQCLQFLKHADMRVRWTAATCLGDLAMFHKILDLDRVVPALLEAIKDEQIKGVAESSLSYVRQAVKPQ